MPAISLRERQVLYTAAILALLAVSALPLRAFAQSEDSQPIPFQNGFAALHEQIGEVMGEPLDPEQRFNEDSADVIQLTTTGLAYWNPTEYSPTFTDGWKRWALKPDGSVIQWEGEDLVPPKPQFIAFNVPAGGGYASYIAAHSKYGLRATCVSRIETGSWTAFYNKQGWPPPYYNEHAQGFFGWLPSTAQKWGVQIMNLDSEIGGFDRMMSAGAGRQFYGIAAGIC